jgi:2-polyprenyl-6-methoxyphenol hydroxylase-like FAD-dependent oxidoreductase
MAAQRKALIVGAGIGGLAAGISLRRAGWDVAVYERAANPRELGFGLLLAPNALAALSELGVANDVLHKARAATGVEVRRLSGEVLRRFNAQRSGQAVVALRSDLHGALLGAIGAGSLRLASEATGFDLRGDGVSIRLANGISDSGDILVGADGVGSVIRRQLHPHDSRPRPSGYCAVRGVVFGIGDVFGDLAAIGYLDDGVEVGTARATSDAVYWYISLLSRDIDSPHRTAPALVGRFLETEVKDATLRTVLQATRVEDMRFDDLFRTDPLSSWGTGPVTLLGDAAHPMLPHTGQGAAQALEDAVALGLSLSAGGDIDSALRRYEAVRTRRTRKFVRLGPRMAGFLTTRNPMIQALRTLAIRRLPERALTPFKPEPDPHAELRSRHQSQGVLS